MQTQVDAQFMKFNHGCKFEHLMYLIQNEVISGSRVRYFERTSSDMGVTIRSTHPILA